MTVNNIMGVALKHYAVDKNTNARLFMLAYENQTDEKTCSVVNMDRLNPDLRSELTEIMNSNEVQKTIDPYVVLDKKFFYEYPKDTLLNVLRKMKLIEVKNSEDVLVQMKNDEQWTPDKIMDAIRQSTDKFNKTLKGKDQLLKEKTAEIEQVKTIEQKNSSDIEDLRKELSSLKDDIRELISSLKESKGSKK